MSAIKIALYAAPPLTQAPKSRGKLSIYPNTDAEMATANQGGDRPMSEPIRWLTEPQAAKYIERSPRTLRMWRQHNEVVSYRQSRTKIMYDVESLNRCAALQDSRRLYVSERRPLDELVSA